jgi:type I restriction enzyme R subunit
VPDDEGEVFVDPFPPTEGGGKRFKYYVADVPVSVVAERVQYYDTNGKLITESLKAYTRKNVRKEFSSLDTFIIRWSKADQKKAIIDELEEQGILLSAVAEEVGKDYDAFDLVCHVAFDQPPLTRKERAENVRKRNYFTRYGEKARIVLDALLNKYADEGIVSIEDIKILTVPPISGIARPLEIFEEFGGKEKYLQAVKELEEELYKAA